jgi:cobalt transporter subunit CbtA
MTYKMLASGLIAGFAAGLFAALLHFAFTQPLLLLGEQYEMGDMTHFGTMGSHATPSDADAPQATPSEAPAQDQIGNAEAADHDHMSHDHGAAPMMGEDNSTQRNALTVLFMGFTYAAYGILLAAGYGLATHYGYAITVERGLLWGLGGFLAFHLAPALGLAPELPGTIAADLVHRQIWWLATVIATAAGLALFASGRWGIWAWIVAGALLAAPHGIGAPMVDGFYGSAPPELSSLYAARSLGVALVAWLVLGWLSARLWTEKTA